MNRATSVLSRVALCGLAVGIWAAGCSEGPSEHEVLVARLDEVARRFETFGFGGSVLVARNDEILLHRGYGIADTVTGRRVDSATVFSIGSVTKQFTAAALLALEREGTLRPEALLSSVLDSVPSALDGVSLHHVLTHTSGLARDVGDDYDTIGRDPYVDSIFVRPLRFPPGNEYAYSNAGYSLLGAVVEIVSGQEYQTFLEDRLFSPLGMSRTGYLRDFPENEVVRYQNPRTEYESPLDRPLFWVLKGNGGLLSTTGDLYRWIRALQTGEALDRGAWFELTAPLARVSPVESYGYGWKVGTTWRGTRAIWHEGVSAEGVGALLRRLPEEDATIIVLGHTIRDDVIPGFRVAHALERALLGEEISIAPPPGTDRIAGARSSGASAPTGTYHVTGGGTITVSELDEDERDEGSRARLLLEISDQKTASRVLQLPNEGDSVRHEAAREISRTTYEAMMSGDFEPLRANLWSDVRFEGEREFWSAVREALGALRSLRFLGSVWDGPVLELYAMAEHEDRAHPIRFHRRPDGSLYVFTTSGFALPTRIPLVPLMDGSYAGYDFEFTASVHVHHEPGESGEGASLRFGPGVRAVAELGSGSS